MPNGGAQAGRSMCPHLSSISCAPENSLPRGGVSRCHSHIVEENNGIRTASRLSAWPKKQAPAPESRWDSEVKKLDMRSLSPDNRYKRRLEVIRLRKTGLSHFAIGSATGLSRTGVFDICKRFAEEGLAGMRDAPASPTAGAVRLLAPVQEALIRQLVSDNTPDQLSLPYPLWTRAAVARLIDRRLGIQLNVRTFGTYLARWGFAPRKVARHPGESSSAAGRHWLREELPAIEVKVKAQDGEICWGSDTPLLDEAAGSPSGNGDELETHAAKVSRPMSLTAAVNNKGQMRWRVHHGRLTPMELISFMRRLVKGGRKKVFLLLESSRVQRAQPVQAWLIEHVDEIQVFDKPRDHLSQLSGRLDRSTVQHTV